MRTYLKAYLTERTEKTRTYELTEPIKRTGEGIEFNETKTITIKENRYEKTAEIEQGGIKLKIYDHTKRTEEERLIPDQEIIRKLAKANGYHYMRKNL